ncbi:hypothetical protein ACPCVO_50450 [Streptomyces umbrinus]|uniref:hypothetical protein n=1 Tax=Streptomyces umbrinus TaxID=67370 RepID=UPI003C2E3BD8
MRYGVVVEELASEVMAELPTDEARREVLELVELWAARHGEWRRITALMDGQDWPICSPEQGIQGSTWARERDARREGALARHAVWEKGRQDARDELKTQVWLSADVSRRLRDRRPHRP